MPVTRASCDVYIQFQRTVREIFSFRNVPPLYRFAASNLRVTASNTMHGLDSSRINPLEYALPDRYQWVDSRLGSWGNSCIFTQMKYSGATWRKRECGSTDNNLSRADSSIRSFVGEVLDSRTLISDICCDISTFDYEFFQREIANSLMEQLVELVHQRLLEAIFAPVYECGAGYAGSTKTFLDDTAGREIDLSTNPLSIAKVISALTEINVLTSPMEQWFWFVPYQFYSILAGLMTTANCCNLLQPATIIENGATTSLGAGLQFSMLPYIKIIPIDQSYFPVSAGKTVTALIPKGVIAFTIEKPPMLQLSGVNGGDKMTTIRPLVTKALNTDLGESKVVWIESFRKSDINYNSEVAAFVSLVVGRLKNNRMYRILLNATPTASDDPMASDYPMTSYSPEVAKISKITRSQS